MRVFVALKTFESPELVSTYVEGLSYVICDNNTYLEALAEVWALEGKIHFEHDPIKQRIKGKGQDLTTIVFQLQETVLTLQTKLTYERAQHAYTTQQLDQLSSETTKTIAHLEFERLNHETAYNDLVTLLTPSPSEMVSPPSFKERLKTAWRTLWP